ncbi:MAG: hypothetical protein LBS26_01600 [Campylobacteraceae bacterium]|jgi:hypothetical protein|nr:hypothetical protein [Campylobacteraceae bacterium]
MEEVIIPNSIAEAITDEIMECFGILGLKRELSIAKCEADTVTDCLIKKIDRVYGLLFDEVIIKQFLAANPVADLKQF